MAVGQELLQRSARDGHAGVSNITLRHGIAEDSKLAADSVDVVSVSLMMHELPEQATRNIMQEAYRCAPFPVLQVK